MKIISDAESLGIKIVFFMLVVLLVAELLVILKADPVIPEQPSHCVDTVVIHDTIVDVHPITHYKTIHDTIYITQ